MSDSQPSIQAESITKKGILSPYLGKPLVETLANGFFIVNPQWTVTYWNKAAERILGIEERDIVGKNLWEEFAEQIPVEFYSVYYKAFLEDIPIHFQEYWAEMGAWFDVTTWYSDNNLSVSFKSSLQPAIENYPKPGEEFTTLTQLYRYVSEITMDCLWEWDLATREIFWIDGGHKRVFGYQIENTLVPQHFWENCIHPEDRGRVLSRLQQFLHDGKEFWEDQYRFKRVDGRYIYVCDRVHIFYYEKGIASRMIGATQDIDHRISLEIQLSDQKKRHQRDVTSAVLEALEKERVSIGEELHDNLGQLLAVAKLNLQIAVKMEVDAGLFIEKALELVTQVINEIRRIAKTLVIPQNNVIGLFDNIRVLINDITSANVLKVKFRVVDIEESDFSEELQIAVFRIIQEQFNNILKHAGAAKANITLAKKEGAIILLVEDDGKGLDPLNDSKGVGIINIRSRVELFSGTVLINSFPGDGYKLEIHFPVDDGRGKVGNM